jgi:PhnB protein
MQHVNFPSDYQQVMPYLIVNNAAAFMQFLYDVFDAEEKMKHMRDENIIAHAEVRIGTSVIMLGDAIEGWPPVTGSFFIYVPNADATYEKALANGATSIQAVSHQPYGRSGGILDPYGNTWWVTTHVQAK